MNNSPTSTPNTLISYKKSQFGFATVLMPCLWALTPLGLPRHMCRMSNLTSPHQTSKSMTMS